MKAIIKTLVAVSSLSLMAGFASAQTANTLDQLLDQVKSDRISEQRINAARERAFLDARADKQALLRTAQATLQVQRY